MYTYLIINIMTISVPLFRSFEHRIAYYKKFRSLFVAIALTAVFFIIWDSIFTKIGVWSFNDEFLIGIYFLNLPLEEWFFFITVPFACIFIYEVLNYFIKKDYLGNFSKAITLFLIAILFIMAALNLDKLYTTVTFIFTAALLILQLLIRAEYLGRFYLAYLVHLIPFFIVNGILTALPVVIYNNTENLSLRIGTIPVEDMIYSMMLLLMNITIYEFINKKFGKSNI